jgi:blue light- and temperature-responsive anti-repressor
MATKVNFSYAFQPIVDVINKAPYSYEALLRGLNNEPPTNIFAHVSRISFADFDQKAKELAISLAVKLGLKSNLSLNFLPKSLATGNYLDQTIIALQENHLKPKQLIIELNESEIIYHQNDILYGMNKWRNKGIKIAIDDFGAGYCNLNLLLNCQPDIIKLDRQLIRKIDSQGPKQAIVKAILDVCIALDITIIAVGVETPSEYLWLKNQGIYLFQGYLFAKPGFECLPSIAYPEV